MLIGESPHGVLNLFVLNILLECRTLGEERKTIALSESSQFDQNKMPTAAATPSTFASVGLPFDIRSVRALS
jgi:hypothetical protein